MKRIYVICMLPVLLFSCVSNQNKAGTGLSIYEAVEYSAENIAADLPTGSRVAIVAFDSPNDNLSEFIMEELAGALFDSRIEVADRQNLAYVYQELNLQMSGDVSDDSAQAIGKFLGAELVITGQLILAGKATYRYRVNAIHVEKATRASITRLDVSNNKDTRKMITAISGQTSLAKTGKPGADGQKTPQTWGTFIDRGIQFASRGEYENAIADFTEALTMNPGLSAAYILRGRALYASVSYVSSTEDNFVEVNTVNIIGEAISAEQMKIYEKSIDDFNQAITLDPDNPRAYLERGIMLNKIGEYNPAINDFTQAIRMDSNLMRAYIERADSHYLKQDYDLAIADLTQAINLNPNYFLAYSERGFVYLEKNDFDRAINDLTSAIELDQSHISPYINRGDAFYSKGDYERSLADYTQAIRIDPNFTICYLNRGNVYYALEDYTRAIADFSQGLKSQPTNANAYFNRGASYFAQGNYDRALADLNQSIMLNSKNAVAFNFRGNIYYSKGDYRRAITDYERALNLDNDDDVIRNNLENARRAAQGN